MSNEADALSPKPAAPKSRRPGGQGSKRPDRGGPGDERRKRGSSGGGSPRRQGFNDDLDHALCLHYHHRLPHEFPPHDRSGLAMLKPSNVSTRPGAVLLCDQQHPGSCAWPDGEPVRSDEPDPAPV